MPGPSGSMLCDDGAAVRIRTWASTFVAVNVASGADRAVLPEAGGVRGLRLPSRHGRKAYLLGSSGDCRSGSVWKVPAHRLMLAPNGLDGSLVA